ncbi:ribosome recycling factor [Patescibacteria group bacterium]|nr:ribosome recycling factor [Patescibacteria group bacterium]
MNFDFTETEKSLDGIAQYLKQEYLQISTGRANPALLDGVMVNSYGSMQPIKNIASINLEDARTMKVSPWDKNQIKDIEKAILDSQLPFSLSIDEGGVRVHIPQMTEESKTKILKIVKEKLEDARIKARNVRHDTMKYIEENEEYSEDMQKKFKEDLEKKIVTANKQLEDIYTHKERDIMSV